METRSLILSPDQYTEVTPYELLCAAEQGFVGLDHRFLHALVDHPEKSIPDLVRFGMEKRDDVRLDLTPDLIEIFRHLRTPQAIPFFLENIRRNGMDATMPMINALREVGEPAVVPLLEFYKEAGDEEDSDAGFLLGSLGIRDPRIFDVLIARLEVDPVDAAHCLAVYDDPAAIPAIREAIGRMEGEKVEGEEWMVQSLRSAVEELEAGRKLEEDDEPFDLWSLYPEESDPEFDVLTDSEKEQFLSSPDADNRFAAVSVLSEQDRPRLWDRYLKMAREDPDIRVRGHCWQALDTGWERPDIRAAMKACLANERASVDERCGALQSLSVREGENAEVQRWILEFYSQPETRAEALQAMINSFEPRFQKYFPKHLGDPDPSVCIQAMLGIAVFQLESEAPRLLPYFDDEILRYSALTAYAFCAPCDISRPGFRHLFQRVETLACGLSVEEETAVKDALNTRSEREDLGPLYGPEGEILLDKTVVSKVKTGRNEPCPCGSGKKYKKCCGK